VTAPALRWPDCAGCPVAALGLVCPAVSRLHRPFCRLLAASRAAWECILLRLAREELAAASPKPRLTIDQLAALRRRPGGT
jgi:hypothetical protein